MWIMMNDSFFSIVADRKEPDLLLVRARKQGDIEAVFPEAKTWEDPSADYHFRANILRGQVAEALADRAKWIGYHNFKDSVPPGERQDAYHRVWAILWEWGNRDR